METCERSGTNDQGIDYASPKNPIRLIGPLMDGSRKAVGPHHCAFGRFWLCPQCLMIVGPHSVPRKEAPASSAYVRLQLNTQRGNGGGVLPLLGRLRHMCPEFAVSLSYRRTSQNTEKPSTLQGPGRVRTRLQPECLHLRLAFRHSNTQQEGDQGLHGGSVVSPGLHWGKAGLQAEGGWVSVGCLG